MHNIKTWSILFLFFATTSTTTYQGRLENIIKLVTKETNTIVDTIYAKLPGTLPKYLQPKNIQQNIQFQFNKRGLASSIDDNSFKNYVAKLRKDIRKKLNQQEIELDLSNILSKGIIGQFSKQLGLTSGMIVQFNGHYIAEGSKHWWDVEYYVYGEIEYKISESYFFIFLDWFTRNIEEYVFSWIISILEYISDFKHQYRFNFKIDLNGLSVPRENIKNLLNLIKGKNFDEAIESLRKSHGVTWDDLDL